MATAGYHPITGEWMSSRQASDYQLRLDAVYGVGVRLDFQADLARRLADLPVQGPAGAPFRPGDRFRMVSGNGQVVRTGTILQWDVPFPNTRPGHWYVEVDPLPRPPGARVRKHDPWDGFRTWFDADQLERVP